MRTFNWEHLITFNDWDFKIQVLSNTILAVLDKIMDKNKCTFKKLRRIWMQMLKLNPKKAWGSIWPPYGFSKYLSCKESVKPWLLVTFNAIINNIFLENLMEISQFVQKIWRLSLSILPIFCNFHQVFGFFDISLLQGN